MFKDALQTILPFQWEKLPAQNITIQNTCVLFRDPQHLSSGHGQLHPFSPKRALPWHVALSFGVEPPNNTR